MINIGYVCNADVKLQGVNKIDKYDRGAIMVKVMPDDMGKSDNDATLLAVPLLPRMFNARPKMGESVLVFTADNGANTAMRFYLGPILSNLNNINFESVNNAMAFFNNSSVGQVVEKNDDGVFPNPDEIAILGRKNGDIILGDDEIKIRCGVKKMNENGRVGFNREDPTFIKIKYHTKPLEIKSNVFKNAKEAKSTATIVGDYITLASNHGGNLTVKNNGVNEYKVKDTSSLIMEEDMKKLIDAAHPLPYGDVLCNFLGAFLNAFLKHTHNYGINEKPIENVPEMNALKMYGRTTKDLYEKLLDPYIRIA